MAQLKRIARVSRDGNTRLAAYTTLGRAGERVVVCHQQRKRQAEDQKRFLLGGDAFGPDDPEGNAGGLPLEAIALFADAVGPYKGLLFNEDGSSSGYVEAAHDLGLVVHTWTVRDDREPIIGATVEEELRALYALGVDGVFSDFPATAIRVRSDMAAEHGQP